MILPFIESTLDINSETGNKISGIDNSVTENISMDNSDNNSLAVTQNDEDSFEMKYKALMKKIEKERFERELLAGNR